MNPKGKRTFFPGAEDLYWVRGPSDLILQHKPGSQVHVFTSTKPVAAVCLSASPHFRHSEDDFPIKSPCSSTETTLGGHVWRRPALQRQTAVSSSHLKLQEPALPKEALPPPDASYSTFVCTSVHICTRAPALGCPHWPLTHAGCGYRP